MITHPEACEVTRLKAGTGLKALLITTPITSAEFNLFSRNGGLSCEHKPNELITVSSASAHL